MRLPVGAPRSGGPPGSRIQQAPSVDFGAIRADRVAASPRPAPASARSPHVAHGGGPRSLAHGPLRYRLGDTRRKPRDVGVPSGHMGRADPGGRIPAGSPAACWALETVADSAHALTGKLGSPVRAERPAQPGIAGHRATGPLSEEVLPRQRCAVRSQSDPGCAKTKSDLVVMPSGGHGPTSATPFSTGLFDTPLISGVPLRRRVS
jgi:hypothetical protein